MVVLMKNLRGVAQAFFVLFWYFFRDNAFDLYFRLTLAMFMTSLVSNSYFKASFLP